MPTVAVVAAVALAGLAAVERVWGDGSDVDTAGCWMKAEVQFLRHMRPTFYGRVNYCIVAHRSTS